jgi:hypothetical protein
MANYGGQITLDYYASDLADVEAVEKKLNELIDLLSRRSNDLDGVNWDNVNWTIEEEN